MRFSEWMNKLNEQQKRVNDVSLSDVSETICVQGRTISITIGKGKYETIVDGSDVGVRFLRSLYTNNKEEFDAMLESITEATDAVATATEEILGAVSDEAVPGAVIARLQGNKTSGDPADLVESMAEKKLEELIGILEDRSATSVGVFSSFAVELVPIAGRGMRIELGHRGYVVRWGRVSWLSTTASIPDTEEAMYFLANYDFIKKRVTEFIEQLRAIK